MPRKVIIGVIGATHRNELPVSQEVLDIARALGKEIGTRDAILLTGGLPDERDRSVKSFAMLGCQEAKLNGVASGHMICVLPKPEPLPPTFLPCLHPVPGTRRLALRTNLSSMGRNPITGGTPDRLIVLRPGKAGTLVELAFARWDDEVAPVFVQAAEHSKRENADQRGRTPDKILAGIFNAMIEFRADGRRDVLNLDAGSLRRALSDHLDTAQDIAAVGAAIAGAAVDAAIAGVPAQIVHSTRFEGLPSVEPGGKRLLMDDFEKLVEKLSDLSPGGAFK